MWNKVYEKSKEFTKVDKEMDKRLQSLANHTWDIIGGDILNNLTECGEDALMKRSDVIEVVCDADYMLMHGDDHDAYSYFLFLSEKHRNHRNKVMKEAFPFKHYGW